MKMEIVIHHHFKFSKGILNNTGKSKNITFESIPFFKMYSWKYLDLIRSKIDFLTAPMPHELQKTISSIKPPKHLENAPYRADSITMTYCVFNRQAFFVRAYYLRDKGSKFFKVEIILHSNTLGRGKYLILEKAINGTNLFFKQLEESNAFSLSPNIHLPEYFYIDEFVSLVSVFENELTLVRDCSNPNQKRVLIETLRNELLEFQKNAKGKATERLNDLKALQEIKLLRSNYPISL